MAATTYESVVSLMHTIDHVVEHGHNYFDLNCEQILSVHEKAAILLEFLECYSGTGDNKEVEALELQISNAAHGVEDVIENKVVHYIRDNQSTNLDRMRTNIQRLKKVIRVMDLVINKAMGINGKREVKVQLPKDLTPSTSSSSVPPIGNKDVMVGFNDVLIRIKDRLFQQQSNRLVIPISGMGGIGKTTLARNVYQTPYIKKQFDICAWITISQTYDIKGILLSLLTEFKESTAQGMNEQQLGDKVHKHLFGRRYLIVMDDMWNIDAWEKLQLFFPENRNKSRIIITTRLTKMASCLRSEGLEMDFLDEDQSWNLLREKVFGQAQECPLELEEIGKKIARNCKGLPLSIVVIAGVLAKSNMTQEYWHGVAEKVSSIVSEADDGECSKILSLSYVNLPVHLKPCFLYMGVFPEDHQIDVPDLIRLWVAEGFLKPNRAKILEESAEDYLMDLIDRNLIMVHKHGKLGNVTYCKIHDLLRDLCIREAEKEKFFCVAESLDSSHNQRRIVIGSIGTERRLPASSVLRSITCHSKINISFPGGCRLIRVLKGEYSCIGSSKNIVNLVNLRYLDYYGRHGDEDYDSLLLSISNLLWNMQFLNLIIFQNEYAIGTLDAWKMKQLRYLWLSECTHLTIPGQEESNMKHLNTLRRVQNLILSEGVVKRIPNIKNLVLQYNDSTYCDENKDYYCLSNLQHLYKLEYLRLETSSYKIAQRVVYPQSLKELELRGTCLSWEDISTRIGCLPNLQALTLSRVAFIGEEWNPIEEQFISLKYLQIYTCGRLKVWNAESIHFPVLEKLDLTDMRELKEIPLGIGEIPTLRCIEIKYCRDSVVSSAIAILDEQESLGNTDIKVIVTLHWNTSMKNLEARQNLELRT